MPASKNINSNIAAFLDLLAFSEGTSRLGHNNGYDVIVGGQLFTDYSDHPRVLVQVNDHGLKSTAAGRYQLLARYFDSYKQSLKLPDFSPESQDAIAIQQIREQAAYDSVVKGDLRTAIRRCSNIWASLPGNDYKQRQLTIESLLFKFTALGGHWS